MILGWVFLPVYIKSNVMQIVANRMIEHFCSLLGLYNAGVFEEKIWWRSHTVLFDNTGFDTLCIHQNIRGSVFGCDISQSSTRLESIRVRDSISSVSRNLHYRWYVKYHYGTDFSDNR